MTKRYLSPVRRSNGSIRQKTIQRLQTLALIFIIILLGLKIYIRMFPYSLLDDISPKPCTHCDLPDNESTPTDETEINYSTIDPYENEENDIQPAFHPLPPQSDIEYDFTLVTGASKNHFCPMKSFLYHMKDTLEGLNVRIIVYDLGFSKSQRNTFLQLQELGYLTELRTFKWSYYPSFWNITLSRGEYAWKPAMIAEVARDYPGKLVWLDSGTLVEKRYFTRLNSLLNKYDGFISPRSPGTMETWTHPGVYDYYGDDHTKYDDVINCNGASVTFDTTKTQYLIDDWFKCALVKDCIAPPGSSRANHRQDQAILTYLAAKNNIFCTVNRLNLGIHTHEDRNCKKFNSKYESKHEI